MNDLTSTTQLPLAVEALGTLTYNGAASDRDARISLSGTQVTIDNSICFRLRETVDDQPTDIREWIRLPGFFILLSEQPSCAAEYLWLCYPGCSIEGQWNPSWRFVNSKTGADSCVSPQSAAKLPAPDYSKDLRDHIQLLEQAIIDRAITGAEMLLAGPLKSCYHPRLSFAKGALHFIMEDFHAAKPHFYQAACSGHPDGFEAVIASNAATSRAFLQRFPDLDAILKQGEPLRALTHLRTLKAEHPLDANILLAYALLKAGEPMEGLAACEAALAIDPLLPDVHGHRWNYLFQQERDQEACCAAGEHIRLFPMNLRPYTDGLDASILSGELSAAWWYANQYIVQAVNLHTALKNLFKYFEVTREWSLLERHFDTITPLLRAQTAETLTLHAETLIEVGSFEEAFKLLEQALRAAPERVDTILSYCRGYARMGDLDGAIKLLSTVMNDPSRDDRTTDRFLMLSLLSELYRSVGDLQSAAAIWPDGSTFNAELLQVVGPRPFVEVAYCYAEAGALTDANRVLTLLLEEYKDIFVVQELQDTLAKLVD